MSPYNIPDLALLLPWAVPGSLASKTPLGGWMGKGVREPSDDPKLPSRLVPGILGE